jgi:hypothetical protein
LIQFWGIASITFSLCQSSFSTPPPSSSLFIFAVFVVVTRMKGKGKNIFYESKFMYFLPSSVNRANNKNKEKKNIFPLVRWKATPKKSYLGRSRRKTISSERETVKVKTLFVIFHRKRTQTLTLTSYHHTKGWTWAFCAVFIS